MEPTGDRQSPHFPHYPIPKSKKVQKPNHLQGGGFVGNVVFKQGIEHQQQHLSSKDKKTQEKGLETIAHLKHQLENQPK